MSTVEDKKLRIAGSAYHKLQDLQADLEKKRDEYNKWQGNQFKEGSPLREYYPDQINFRLGLIFKYGNLSGSMPLGRIDRLLVDKANEFEEAISDLNMEMVTYARRIARKLSLKLNRTIYVSQIDFKTGEVNKLPDDIETIDIDVDEDDETTMKKILEDEEKAKEDKVLQA